MARGAESAGGCPTRSAMPYGGRRSSSGMPSGPRKTGLPLSRATRKSPSWTSRWCRRHSRTRFDSAVAPPSAQCRTWCASLQPCGRPHPGNRHPSSRTTTARRSAGGTVGVLRPRSSGSERPIVITRLTSASHARRRAASAEIGPASASSARAVAERHWSASRSTVTTTWGRSPATIAVRAIEEPPTDLTQRVGATLGGRPRIVAAPRPDVRHRAERRDHMLAGFRVEIAVHANHAAEGRRHVEPASLEASIVVARRLGQPAPVRHRPPQLRDRQRSGGVEQGLSRSSERLRLRLPRRHQDVHRGPGDLPGRQRGGRGGQVTEASGLPNLPGGRGEREAETAGQPRHDREGAVSPVGAPPLDLDDATSPLDLEDSRRPFELAEVLLQGGVGHRVEILRAQLFQRRPQRAHGASIRTGVRPCL
jgi:hypothetical protein